MFQEIIQDEILTNEILILLHEKAHTIPELAQLIGVSSPRAVRQVANMLRTGLLKPDGVRNDAPCFVLYEKDTERESLAAEVCL